METKAMASSVDLGSRPEKFVTRLVKSRRYHSKSEVFRERVRLIQERAAELELLDLAIGRGITDGDTGRVNP
jgi:antitoxin ParD1/3/4